MRHSANLIDTSSELLLRRFHKGVKLVKPQSLSSLENNDKSVSQLLSMSFHVYFVNTESIVQNLNEITAINCGFNSISDAKGKTTSVVATKQSAEFIRRHDLSVMVLNEMRIKDEGYQRLDGKMILNGISIKFPLYGVDNKIIGIFGCSLPIGVHNCCALSDALSLMINAGLLNNFLTFYNVDTDVMPNIDLSCLSVREKECLYYFLRGKTAKDTANILGLSYRTVEFYFNNIKQKFKVTSKRDLLEKFLDYRV